VASLAALELASEAGLDDAALARRVFDAALCAHRIAQGGGSGIDVAASAFGGVLRFRLPSEGVIPLTAPFALPSSLVVRVWSSTSAAATSSMLAGVNALKNDRPDEYRRVIDALAGAATAAIEAPTAEAYIAAMRRQLDGLAELGRLAQVPIVTPEVAELDRTAKRAGGAILPSGAGGGDIVLMLTEGPPSSELQSAGEKLGLVPLPLTLGARGVHALAPSPAGDRRSEALP
jgi:phosphomevalonate kinase